MCASMKAGTVVQTSRGLFELAYRNGWRPDMYAAHPVEHGIANTERLRIILVSEIEYVLNPEQAIMPGVVMKPKQYE